jgi:hypothetical protein
LMMSVTTLNVRFRVGFGFGLGLNGTSYVYRWPIWRPY